MKTARGFTLIEVMVALLVLSLLALMSYRGLGAVLDAREHVKRETDKWQRVAAFYGRFERDVELAAPRPVRSGDRLAPAWLGTPAAETVAASLEFSHFASADGIDTARRIAYRLNEKNEIELWLWPGLDVAPDAQPQHYPVLAGVKTFELQYLNPALLWVNAWPTAPTDKPIPRAVRLRIVLATDEEIVRIFVLQS
ncbi:Type II secretion system protein GspJ [Georgfuchsia toluolica]|uniref:Type II secretion system protein J n=1 Tax=Georgfuchsia toluolica TaxID=424218 RepID=A0A916J3I6_9PROT|nr:type II secretion system protein GspJ [Georgfuchsia toluolica]CAG4883514.1 Type II secretion system protein GspJ [Georgfuchsia toluolica]